MAGASGGAVWVQAAAAVSSRTSQTSLEPRDGEKRELHDWVDDNILRLSILLEAVY